MLNPMSMLRKVFALIHTFNHFLVFVHAVLSVNFIDVSKPAARGNKRNTAKKAAAGTVVEDAVAAEASDSKVTKTRSRKRKADVEVVEESVALTTETRAAPPKRGRKAAQKTDVTSAPEPAEATGLIVCCCM